MPCVFSSSFRDPAECIIEVNSLEITDLYPSIESVTVQASRTQAITASLVLRAYRDEKGSWSVQDTETFLPWIPITIKAAFGTRTQETVFAGYIRDVQASYPNDMGETRVTVNCQDASLALNREHIQKVWGTELVKTTDTLILQEILSSYSLKPEIGNGAGLSDLLLYQNGTDISFLRRRAEANAYELIFYDTGVYFGPKRFTATAQETILVYAGYDTHVSDCKITYDGHKPDAIQFTIALPQGEGLIDKVVKSKLTTLGKTSTTAGALGLSDFVWRLKGQEFSTEKEMEALALQKAEDASLKLRAEGKLNGTNYGHVLQIGLPVELDGVGSVYSGTYYVDEVNHSFTHSGYFQDFVLLRNAYGRS
ncbi:MAG: hypothetical protein V3T17_12895 [Pseudomonadales bacterium]